MNCRARFFSVTGQLFLCVVGTKSCPRPFGEGKAPAPLSLRVSQQKALRVHARFCSGRVKLASGTVCLFFGGAGLLEFTYFQTAGWRVADGSLCKIFLSQVCNPGQAEPKLCQLLERSCSLVITFHRSFFLGTTQITVNAAKKNKTKKKTNTWDGFFLYNVMNDSLYISLCFYNRYAHIHVTQLAFKCASFWKS